MSSVGKAKVFGTAAASWDGKLTLFVLAFGWDCLQPHPQLVLLVPQLSASQLPTDEVADGSRVGMDFQ